MLHHHRDGLDTPTYTENCTYGFYLENFLVALQEVIQSCSTYQFQYVTISAISFCLH